MTIKGNVMVCNACGRQVSMPMEHRTRHKQSLDEQVRSYALEQGWELTQEADTCPEDRKGRPPV
jgi:hypothetical protein